jgi:hypothetical protein
MSTEQQKAAKANQVRNIAYGIFDMQHGDGLDMAEKQIKQLMAIHPTEVYFDILHTPNQTPKALEWKPEVEAMIEVLNERPSVHSVVKLNTNPRVLRARLELDKKAMLSRTKLEERRMDADG